jgi:hypothetical protein
VPSDSDEENSREDLFVCLSNEKQLKDEYSVL